MRKILNKIITVALSLEMVFTSASFVYADDSLSAMQGSESKISEASADNESNDEKLGSEGCNSSMGEEEIVSATDTRMEQNLSHEDMSMCAASSTFLTVDGIGSAQYFSSDTNVVTVEPGWIEAINPGDAVVTVYFSGNDEYLPASVSFNVHVTELGVIASGSCGDNATWSYYMDWTNKTLTKDYVSVTGTGMVVLEENESGYYNWNQCFNYNYFGTNHTINKIVIEDGITDIGDMVFAEKKQNVQSYKMDSSPTVIEIADSVKTIGEKAFFNCSNLETISLGAGVNSIGDYAFTYCSALQNINVSEANQTYKDIDGCLYSKDGTTLYKVPDKYMEYEVPDGVTNIALDAFGDNLSLEKVTLPASIKTISAYAFDGTTNLTSVAYKGSEEDWKNVQIGDRNTTLTGAEFTYGTDNTDISITEQPTDVTALLKDKAVFTVKAENAASYQWQYSKNGGETWSNLKDSSTTSSYIAGATTDSLTILTTATRCSYIYRCQITGTDGEVINSDSASLIKDTALYITTQPKDTVGTMMKKTTFKVTAVNAVSYQWQYSKNDGSTWNTLKDSANTSTYLGGSTTYAVTMLMNASRGSFIYRCQIIGEDGNVAYTDSVKVLLFAITAQPESVQAKAGDTVTFKLGVDYAASYQWYYQKAGSTSWYKLTDNTKASMLINGTTSDTLTIKMTKTRMTYRYRCKVIGQNGTSKYSDAVEILQ